MLNITIIAVGKIKESHWKTAAADLFQRLQPFAKMTLREVESESITPSVTTEMAMQREGEQVRKVVRQLPPSRYAIAMEPYGKKYSSLQFADLLQQQSQDGKPLVFVIGGAAGLPKDLVSEMDAVISLSDMTFTHEMARVILLEQLYRAATILGGKKYHY